MTIHSPATGPFHAEIAQWGPGVYQWQNDEVILGGPDGNDNWPIAELTNRSLWLRQKVEAAATGIESLLAALAAHAAGRDHPAATTTQIGFVELATVTEAVTGTDTTRAVTPAGLAAAITAIPAVPDASDSVAGRVELATVAETTTGTDTARAVTPAGLKAAIAAIPSAPAVPAASDTVAGRVELATVAETTTGTDTTRAVTPAGVNAAIGPGHVAFFATSSAPEGWLKCNGAAVSRAAYAALYGAIGTTFGNGNGATTFNLPDLRGEFIRGWDDGRSVDSGRIFGSGQSGSLIPIDPNGANQTLIMSATSSYLSSTDPAIVAARQGVDLSTSAAYPDAALISATGAFSVGGLDYGVARPRNVALLPCIKF